MKELLARTALVFAAAGGYGLAYANIVAPGEHTEGLSSVIRSDACGGSCISLLRDGSQIFLNVRDPETGDLFKLVPLDLTANAKVGAPKNASPQAHDAQMEQAGSTANDGAQISSIPNPPNGGTGTVVESSPFEDRGGWGEIQITYVFVNYRLNNVLVQRIYFSLLPR